MLYKKWLLDWFVLFILFIFSLQLSAEGKKRLSGELGGDIGEYDYNNANDTANFCPGLQVL